MPATAPGLSPFDRKSLETADAGYVYRCAARFQDVDAAGIVFFARLFDYFHDAYLAFMAHGGLPLADILKAGQWGAPLRRAEADFLAPIRFGDSLEVALVKAAWDGSKLSVGYRITTGEGRIAAVGATHHVVVAFPKLSRIEPPAQLRALFRPLE